MLRVILTNDTSGTFETEKSKISYGDIGGGIDDIGDDRDYSDRRDSEDVWVIRRKPSNPDTMKRQSLSLLGSLGSFGFGF